MGLVKPHFVRKVPEFVNFWMRELPASLTKTFDALELRALFAGEWDEHDAICEVHAGEGGTDAQDWAEMLVRMYRRWAEKHGFDVEIDEVSAGGEAGLLSATFIVKGRYAYGWMRSEQGTRSAARSATACSRDGRSRGRSVSRTPRARSWPRGWPPRTRCRHSTR